MRAVFTIIVFLLLVTLIGCSTTSTVTTFNDKGQIIKVEEVERGAIDKLMESVKDKTIVIWKSGWAGYVSASPATAQDPTPTLKIFAGKMDEGYISVHKDAQNINWLGVASAISATNKSLSLSATGIEEK